MMLRLTAVTLMAAAAPLAAQDFELRREMPAGSRFSLHNIIGDVRVEGGSGRQVEVTARKKPGRHGDPDAVEIRAIETGGAIAVCVYYPGNRVRSVDRDDRDDRDDPDDRAERGGRESSRRRSSSRNPCDRGHVSWDGDRNDTSVDFVIRVPAGLELDLKTVSGDVVGQGLRGGSVDVGAVSGDVYLTDVTATSLEANSVSGDVELVRVSSAEVGAETVSGDVSFGGPIDPRGRYDFKSLSGDVVLTLAKQPDAKVSAVTFSGRLSSDFPMNRDDTRRRRNRFNATWGNGGAELDLESFSGDIEIRTSR